MQRTPEEKWQIVLKGLKSGNVAESCRNTRSLRISITGGRTKWKQEPRLNWGGAQPGAACRAGEDGSNSGASTGPIPFGDRELKIVLGERAAGDPVVGTGMGGPRERSEVGSGDTGDSGSSRYYRRQPYASHGGSFARPEIVLACGEKPA